jgi:2-polyprenyl-6-methoxyphenol hydroxylase-like FAD-dependent oxidoreductase
MRTASETCVLIAGGGPVGLSAAIELGWRGIPAILVNDRRDTAQHPKCNSTNARSMEHFRRLGIAGDLRAAALPSHIERASAYVTRFCGYEFGRLPRPYSDWPTPEIPNNVSQIVLEKVLRRHAERQKGIHIRFGWKLSSFDLRPDGIVADVESTEGEKQTIRARYLIGADGAGSAVRRHLGIGMTGEDGTAHRAFMAGTMLSYYIRSPELMARSGRIPTHSTWIYPCP